jgi:uncharacterized protein (DUF305 family)
MRTIGFALIAALPRIPKLTRHRSIGNAILLCLLATGAVMASPRDSSEGQFLEAMRDIMTTMHHGMATPPTGNIDADFVAMMVPHHQGAIDMARMQLRYGHKERLRRIAQEIIVDQEQEIAVMRLAVEESK